MTKGQFALLTAALGLVTMGGAGYFAYASSGTHSSDSNGASAAGQPTGASTATALVPGDGSSATPDSGGGTGNGGSQNCRNGDIQVSEQAGQGEMGHISLLLVFQNTSGSTCVLHGYPGAALTGRAGTADLNATRALSGALGGAVGLAKAPIVVLAPGADASAVLEWSDVQTGSGCAMQNPVSLLVTPPNTTQTSTLSISTGTEVCSGFEIHPVLEGVVSEPASA
ncbi:DUF4232 domain-containing protein [Actinospica sp. MGRD01-02]|uniref:DUF4232 domain-containing protein n=1 Tax=Actinospica acidithermotolerans TaxID=2828514 RepID=A0A941ECG8_9ACTN|nr:DUF4232 domain-containing protein [Actinospica acidithermotolerans]MBR7828906.1 DUF4232 domain-containing protein [Actinospica acidithermotolerans]